jgi:hypothetical protein
LVGFGFHPVTSLLPIVGHRSQTNASTTTDTNINININIDINTNTNTIAESGIG